MAFIKHSSTLRVFLVAFGVELRTELHKLPDEVFNRPRRLSLACATVIRLQQSSFHRSNVLVICFSWITDSVG